MATGLSLPNAIRDFKRYFEILRILIKHGFGDLVQELKLENQLARGMSIVHLNKNDAAMLHLARPVRIRKVLEELGTTFIKLGQILSLRPDLVPVEWTLELRRLQSRCPEVPF